MAYLPPCFRINGLPDELFITITDTTLVFIIQYASLLLLGYWA